MMWGQKCNSMLSSGGLNFSTSEIREFLITTDLKFKQILPHCFVPLKIKFAGTISPNPAIFIIQGDQKVSVHLMITVQKKHANII
jgi:hypothetical protein